MFCGECGTENPNTNQFCRNCGKPLKKVQPVPTPVMPVQGPAVSFPQAIPPAAAPVQEPKKPSAIRKHALGIIGLIPAGAAFLVYPYILGIIAIIIGAVALKKKSWLGALVIVIAVAAIIVDLFHLQIFPPPRIV
jgi:hypothetical protein